MLEDNNPELASSEIITSTILAKNLHLNANGLDTTAPMAFELFAHLQERCNSEHCKLLVQAMASCLIIFLRSKPDASAVNSANNTAQFDK